MRLLNSANSRGREQADKVAQLQIYATIHENGRMGREADVSGDDEAGGFERPSLPRDVEKSSRKYQN